MCESIALTPLMRVHTAGTLSDRRRASIASVPPGGNIDMCACGVPLLGPARACRRRTDERSLITGECCSIERGPDTWVALDPATCVASRAGSSRAHTCHGPGASQVDIH